eukprot:1950143-Pyramimonas_sp.AAC.1
MIFWLTVLKCLPLRALAEDNQAVCQICKAEDHRNWCACPRHMVDASAIVEPLVSGSCATGLRELCNV